MTFETILFDIKGGVAKLTLNRPDRLNSFIVQMHDEVRQALLALEDARVLVLTGAGRGFCAGQDLSDPAMARSDDSELRRYLRPKLAAARRTVARGR